MNEVYPNHSINLLKIVLKQIFYILINKNESILYTKKNSLNNTNYFILITHFKNI